MKLKRNINIILGLLISISSLNAMEKEVKLEQKIKKEIKIPTEILKKDAERLTKGKFNQLSTNQQNQLLEKLKNDYINQEMLIEVALKSDIEKNSKFKELLNIELEKIKRTIAVNVWAKEELKKINVSKKELEDFYKENKDTELITLPSRYTYNHFMVSKDNKKIIDEIVKKLNIDNPSIEYVNKIFKQYQKDNLITTKFKFEKQPINQFKKEFQDQIINLSNIKNKKYSVIKIDKHYSLVYLISKDNKKILKLKDVEPTIKNILIQRKFKNYLYEKIQEMKKHYKIVE
jgi:hypothetical protein